MDFTRFKIVTQLTASLQIKPFLLLNKQNLLFLFLPPAALRRTQSFMENATPDLLCSCIADKACSSRNRKGVSQLAQSFPNSQFSKLSWKSVVHGTKLEAHLAILPHMSSLTAKSSPRWTDCPPAQRCFVHSLLLPRLPSGISDLS